MHTETQTFYEERILAVLVHIQGHLDDALDLETLGAVAHFSPFHFHRLFTAFVGESVQAHIRRLRLERAAVQLKHGVQGILPIALDAGFQSHEAFTRAFATRFGCPPSAYRPSHQAPAPFRAVSLLSPGDCTMTPMPVRIETLDPMHLAFARGTGPYGEAAGNAWGTLCAWAGPRGLLGPQTRMIGICHDDPQVSPAAKVRYDAAIPVPVTCRAEGPIGIVDLAGGRHAVFTHQGPYDHLADSWNQLVTQWMPQHGHRLGTTPSFEVYLNDPASTPAEALLTDICVPLEG